MKDNNKNNNIEEDKQWMKSMMESARQEPSENLSYRIMHQIETEQALTRVKPKPVKQRSNPLLDLKVFGWMYFVLLLVGGYFYMQGGKEALFTDTFLWTCIFVSSIFSLFFLINTIDNSLQQRRKKKPSTSK